MCYDPLTLCLGAVLVSLWVCCLDLPWSAPLISLLCLSVSLLSLFCVSLHSVSVQVKVKVTLRLTVSKSWCRAPSGAHDQILITVWQLRSCFCGAPSLTWGQVCLLHILLTLASAVFLRSESLETRVHILLSQIWDFPFVASYDLQGHGGGNAYFGKSLRREHQIPLLFLFGVSLLSVSLSRCLFSVRSLFTCRPSNTVLAPRIEDTSPHDCISRCSGFPAIGCLGILNS
jgi:hypothetical protein